jgi:4-amino-4-deoxy-L-arabinose transferase-like glycosyltransferase
MLKKSDNKIIIFWLIILFVHLAYFIFAVINKNILMADSYEYLQQAYNIRNFSSFYCLDFSQPIDMHFFTKRPPLYGVFILILKYIFDSNYFVLFVQNILSVLNVFGVIKLLKEYKFSFDFKRPLVVFMIFLSFQYIYCNMIMSEILLQTMLFWSFYCFFFYLKRNKLSYIFICNVFLSLAVLTKPVLLYFWIPNLLLLFYLFWKRRKVALIISGFIMPLAIFLFSLFNLYATGCFHYSSIKEMNLVGYNSAFLLVNVYGEEESQKRMLEIRRHLKSIDNFKNLLVEEDKIGYEIISENKFVYAKLHLKGMANFFLDPGRFDLNNFLGIKEGNNTGLLYTFTKEGYSGVLKFILKQPLYIIIYIIAIMIINIILLISLINFLFIKRINIETRIFMFLLIFYLCFFSGTLGTMRYKIHIIPLLLFTIPFLFEKIKTKLSKTE